MAITYRASFAGGGSSGTGDRSFAFTPAANDLLVVFVSLSANTQTTVGCSDNNSDGLGAYTQIKQALWSTSANNMVCWVRNALVGSASSTTITVDTDTNSAGEIVVIACAGASKVGSAVVRSSGSQANQASGSTPAPALNQSALTGNMTIAAVAGGDTTTDIATNWTERQDVSQSSPTTCLAVMTRDSGFTGTTITYNSTEGAVYASMALELNPDNDGTLSKTLGTLTSSATGTVDVQGTSSVTLGALTSSATGAVDIQGTASNTLGTLTVSATAITETNGTLSQTLGAATSSASGTVAIAGTTSITLGAATLVADGTVATGGISGTLSATLGAVTSTAAGAVEVQGTLSKTLGALLGTEAGTVDVAGSLGSTLGALTLAATGTVAYATIEGVLAKTLGSLTLVGTAFVPYTPFEVTRTTENPYTPTQVTEPALKAERS